MPQRGQGILHIDPVGDPVGHALPLGDIALNAGLAGLIELGDAVLLDVGLAVEAQLFLDLDLDRQAVGVPAAARADHILAAHAVVADDDILRRARLDVMHARPAVRGRRPLEEDERVGLVAARQRPLDDAAILPPPLDRLLQRGKGDFCVNIFERHSTSRYDCRL